MINQVTIKDIAEILHISPSTVSRALHDHPDISVETKEAVVRLANELDYQPNTIATGLRKSRSYTLGVIVPEIIHYFFSCVISGIEEVAYREGYRVIICQSNERYERELININTLLAGRVDGILISLSKNTVRYDHIQQLVSKEMPVVFFDRICEPVLTPRITVDDYEGAMEATEHLIRQGCRRIAHYSGRDTLMICRERKRGYVDAHKKLGIPLDPNLILLADGKPEAMEVTRTLMNQDHPPDAIFAVNDNAAVGALLSLKSMNIAIPDQVAIVGFTDDPTITTIVDPPMSSVEQPAFAMGKASAGIIIKNLESGIIQPEDIVLKTRLVVRKSSMKNQV